MIRPYHEKDRTEIIALLKLNIPTYFDPSEEKDFVEYLDQHLEDYFVFEKEGKLIGSGGVNYAPDGSTARISWDFIHPNHHRQGIGKQLTLHRIAHIKIHPNIRHITVRTSQLAYTFYQKMGFALIRTEKDFWAKGFDLYEMQLTLRKN